MWMTGVEADYQWAHFTGTGMSAFHLGDVGNATMIATQSVTSFGTLRARMGYTHRSAAFVWHRWIGLRAGRRDLQYAVPGGRHAHLR
jgi:hypothetical protein